MTADGSSFLRVCNGVASCLRKCRSDRLRHPPTSRPKRSAKVRRLLSVLCGCCLIVPGCADQEDSYGPLRGVHDGDIHNVYVRLFCGADYLDVVVNDIGWRADELNGDERGWIPREWAAAARTVDGVSDMLMVALRMESNGSRLIATAQGRTVVYRPTTSEDPPNECE